jgi:uncharacterized membrane protein
LPGVGLAAPEIPMESRATFLGHPIHQQLVVFPLGLLGAAVVFDLIHLFSGAPTMAVVAYWLIIGGLVGGAVAAPFGTIDWLAIPPGTRARRVGAAHGGINVVVLVLFAISAWLRIGAETDPSAAARAFAYAAVALALVSAWLGGELVGRLGVSVQPGAHLDASSSLSRRPASDAAE